MPTPCYQNPMLRKQGVGDWWGKEWQNVSIIDHL